jgi:hypothetical protein
MLMILLLGYKLMVVAVPGIPSSFYLNDPADPGVFTHGDYISIAACGYLQENARWRHDEPWFLSAEAVSGSAVACRDLISAQSVVPGS